MAQGGRSGLLLHVNELPPLCEEVTDLDPPTRTVHRDEFLIHQGKALRTRNTLVVVFFGLACTAWWQSEVRLGKLHHEVPNLIRKTRQAIVPPTSIPLLYSVAMGVDALAALIVGRAFDRYGLSVLAATVLLSALFAPLVFLGRPLAALAGMTLWGVGMGAQESIMRAAVAEMVAADRRGAAYGIFNAGYGVFWFLGSTAMGLLYDTSIPVLVAFSVAAQLAAIPLILRARRS